MLFQDIKPFIRFARYMKISSEAYYPTTVPCDARLFYVKDGIATLTVDGVDYHMKRGDIMLFRAGTSYRICEGSPCITYILLNFDFTFDASSITVPIPPKPSDEFSPRDIIDPSVFEDGELSRPVYLTGMEKLGAKLEKIEREYSRKYLHYEIKISGILTDVIVSCMRARDELELGRTHAKIEEIIQYLHLHSAEAITNITIGELFGFHPNYISALVKRYTGIPLHRYLLQVRLSKAEELITQTELSIEEIAESTGFCDIYYFSRYFKMSFGTSPSEYRRKNAGI